MKKRIGLIFGGPSGEHEVSLASAANIAAGFAETNMEVFPILITRQGRWYGPIPREEIATAKGEQYTDKEIMLAPYPGGVILSTETGAEISRLDAVFPIVHGNTGEDGVLQGLMELAGIPCVGPGVTASALCMDKVMMKKILQYHDIPLVKSMCVYRSTMEQNMRKTLDQVEATLDYPMFVKPSNGGSSVGAGKAKNRETLEKLLQVAAHYDTKVLVERSVNAREIEVAVLGNENPMVSMPGEIISCNEFYDYQAKYVETGSVCNIPATLGEDQIQQIRSLAKEVFLALECRGMARVDFFLENETGKIYLNEVNSLPGFTDISMYPKMCEAMGVSLPNLLERLVVLAEECFAEKRRNAISPE